MVYHFPVRVNCTTLLGAEITACVKASLVQKIRRGDAPWSIRRRIGLQSTVLVRISYENSFSIGLLITRRSSVQIPLHNSNPMQRNPRNTGDFSAFVFAWKRGNVRCLSVNPKNSCSRRISVRHIVRICIRLTLLINTICHARHGFRLRLLKRMRINIQRRICVIVT